ncbi:hypothetical protein BH24BAC1_BH24BAC1_26290 [soil metagenome]
MFKKEHMPKGFLIIFLLFPFLAQAQIPVNLSGFDKRGGATVAARGNLLDITWPAGGTEKGRMTLNLEKEKPLFTSLQMSRKGAWQEIATDLDPAFVLTVGKRDLISQNGWNIFFDKTAYLPHQSFPVRLEKRQAKVVSTGARTRIVISEVAAGDFLGALEITLFKGSPLFNVAAVMTTEVDSLAILYDAGLVNKGPSWEQVVWTDTDNFVQAAKTDNQTGSKNLAVKYRTIAGESKNGGLAIFPAPHQYFYPLDNAYNLNFTWYGDNYRGLIPGFGIGIRQDLMGDRRWVPWFNAPPQNEHRLNFFCLLSTSTDGNVLADVRRFTHHDSYRPLPGYYTLASHFHTEHVDDVLTHKPLPEIPGHVKALRQTGVNIMHLGEFHLAGNPRDLGPRRLTEFKKMFEECARLSGGNFLMLPGEEPHSHFGGHWMNIFPKPVYWIMSRQPEQPFVQEDPEYGKIYRVGNKEELLKLLEEEKGLAWTAHARTKGSTGFPDKYKDEAFFKSDRFLGAAWKAMPADLSQPRLGKRVLDLMDDMANWGHRKYVLGEADVFKIEPDYELYAHMNINYLQLERLPKFEEGWQPVLDALESGKFFVSTGEVLLPAFQVNGKNSGETAQVGKNGKAEVLLEVDWTFPLQFAEIISGDGNQVYRERIDLQTTEAFGKQRFAFTPNLKNRNWVRVEVWDAAANGAFTQFVWLE